MSEIFLPEGSNNTVSLSRSGLMIRQNFFGSLLSVVGKVICRKLLRAVLSAEMYALFAFLYASHRVSEGECLAERKNHFFLLHSRFMYKVYQCALE